VRAHVVNQNLLAPSNAADPNLNVYGQNPTEVRETKMVDEEIRATEMVGEAQQIADQQTATQQGARVRSKRWDQCLSNRGVLWTAVGSLSEIDYYEPPVGATVVEVESYRLNGIIRDSTIPIMCYDACSCDGKRRQMFNPRISKPPAADAMSEASWQVFAMEMERLVGSFLRELLWPKRIVRLLLIWILFFFIWTIFVEPGSGDDEVTWWTLFSHDPVLGPFTLGFILAAFFLFWGHLWFVKAANIKVDAKIRELCARYSDGSVTLKWETRYVGVFRFPYTPKAQEGTYISKNSKSYHIGGQNLATIYIPAYRALWVFTTGADHGSRLLDVTAELAQKVWGGRWKRFKFWQEPLHANDPRYGGVRVPPDPRTMNRPEMNSRL